MKIHPHFINLHFGSVNFHFTPNWCNFTLFKCSLNTQKFRVQFLKEIVCLEARLLLTAELISDVITIMNTRKTRRIEIKSNLMNVL